MSKWWIGNADTDPLDTEPDEDGWVIPGVIPFEDGMADEYNED